MPAGAVSRKSSTVTVRVLASQIMAKPPPPIPLETGCVSPTVNVPAMAASTALPPLLRISIAIFVAVALSLATAQRCDRAGLGATTGADGATVAVVRGATADAWDAGAGRRWS